MQELTTTHTEATFYIWLTSQWTTQSEFKFVPMPNLSQQMVTVE